VWSRCFISASASSTASSTMSLSSSSAISSDTSSESSWKRFERRCALLVLGSRERLRERARASPSIFEGRCSRPRLAQWGPRPALLDARRESLEPLDFGERKASSGPSLREVDLEEAERRPELPAVCGDESPFLDGLEDMVRRN
jgi:hypothetical protein